MAVKRSVNKSVLLSESEAKMLRELCFHGGFKSESEVLRVALHEYSGLFEIYQKLGIEPGKGLDDECHGYFFGGAMTLENLKGYLDEMTKGGE